MIVLNLGDELVVDGVTYVLIDGRKIRLMTGDINTWICEFCQLMSYCKYYNCELELGCGHGQHIFVKKLEV